MMSDLHVQMELLISSSLSDENELIMHLAQREKESKARIKAEA